MKTWELTEKEKKTLERYNNYLIAICGDDGINWTGYIYEGEFDYNGNIKAMPTKNGWERKDEIDHNEPAMKILNGIAESTLKNTDYDKYTDCDDCDGSGYVSLYYNPMTKTFKTEIDVNETKSDDRSTNRTFEQVLEGTDNYTRNNEFKKLKDQSYIDELINENNGQTEFEFPYQGYGDSGQIETSLSWGSKIVSIAYEIIDLYYGGWENDGGADGVIIINLENKTISIRHTDYYTESFTVDGDEIKLV